MLMLNRGPGGKTGGVPGRVRARMSANFYSLDQDFLQIQLEGIIR
jgi:hypothetical protein